MGSTLMTNYGYIIDNTYQVADTAITWDFVRYNDDESTTDFVGIESIVAIDSDKALSESIATMLSMPTKSVVDSSSLYLTKSQVIAVSAT